MLSPCWSINSFLTLLPQFDLNLLRANIHISLKGQQKKPGQCARWVQRLLLLRFLYCEIKTFEHRTFFGLPLCMENSKLFLSDTDNNLVRSS